MRRRTFIRAGLASVVGLGALGGLGEALSTPAGPADDAPEGSPVSDTSPSGVGQVERRTLTLAKEFNARVNYGDAFALPITATGTVTATPATDVVIAPGDEIMRVDDKPIFLARGVLPMYRTLKRFPDVRVPGERYMVGYDVAHLKTFLSDAGFDDDGEMELDGEFDPATERAVKAWQKAVGLAVTGRVDASQLVIHPDPVRIDTSPQFGAPFAAPSVTPIDQRLTFNVPSRDRRLLTEGGTVSITSPDTDAVEGVITKLERTVSDEGASVVSATAVPASPLPPTTTSAVVTASDTLADDVLAVPVRALLAVSQGGLAVELTDGRLVAVEVGAVADGWAEVDGDLAEGDGVVTAQ